MLFLIGFGGRQFDTHPRAALARDGAALAAAAGEMAAFAEGLRQGQMHETVCLFKGPPPQVASVFLSVSL